MATFYRGHRPVLKGRTSTDAKHPYKGVGNYSNWSLHNTSHILDGAPDRAVQPGEGKFPHGIQMSRWSRGLDHGNVMDGSGLGVRQASGRFRPLIFKGLTNSQAMVNPGHAYRRQVYTFSRNSTTLFFQGVPSANPILTGHAIRNVGAPGTANSFGRSNPYLYQGATSSTPLQGGGHTKPAAGNTGYGNQHVNEWFGVKRAL